LCRRFRIRNNNTTPKSPSEHLLIYVWSTPFQKTTIAASYKTSYRVRREFSTRTNRSRNKTFLNGLLCLRHANWVPARGFSICRAANVNPPNMSLTTAYLHVNTVYPKPPPRYTNYLFRKRSGLNNNPLIKKNLTHKPFTDILQNDSSVVGAENSEREKNKYIKLIKKRHSTNSSFTTSFWGILLITLF